METTNHVSIQSLLDELCESIYKDVNSPTEVIAHSPYQAAGQQKNHNIPEELLKKCKKNAFEILLKKSNVKSLAANRASIDEGYSEVIDPVRELQYSQFEYSIFVGEMRPSFGPYGFVKSREEKKILDKLALFQECQQIVEGNEFFCNEQHDGYAILWFLTLLKNQSSVDTLLTVEPYFSLPLDQLQSLPMAQVNKYFKLNWEPSVELQQNPYCEAMWKLNRRSNLFHLPAITDATNQKQNKCVQQSIVEEVLELVRSRLPSNNIYYEANKWEHRGLRIPLNKDIDPELLESLYEKKFCTELPDASLNLLAIEAAKQQQSFRALIIDKKRFIEHIKLLLIGIESESFAYCANTMTFKLLDDLTVENMTPKTMAHFVLDFVECGSCYKRLKSLISTNNYVSNHTGIVFKV